jgi:hypothetical protein
MFVCCMLFVVILVTISAAGAGHCSHNSALPSLGQWACRTRAQRSNRHACVMTWVAVTGVVLLFRCREMFALATRFVCRSSQSFDPLDWDDYHWDRLLILVQQPMSLQETLLGCYL